MAKVFKFALMCGVAGSSMLAATASAQEAAAAPSETQGDAIIVTGVRASLEKALDIKRERAEFVEALVAEDIAQFPDSNLGEALQRLPGITVERQESGSQSNAVGEGATINLRGLGPSFTRTEINGATAPNPGTDRGFGFNILSSDLFQTAVVSKSLSARDNEGGLAGTVQLSTYRPLDFKEMLINVSARGIITDLNDEIAPAASLIFADQFFDDTFGVAFGIAFDQTKPRENIADNTNWEFLRDSLRGNFTALPQAQRDALQNVIIPRDPRILINERDQKRLNATLTLQWRPSDNLLLTFDNIYAMVDHTGRQTRNDYPIEGFPATFVPVDLVRDGDTFVSGTFPAASHYGRILDYDYDVRTELYHGVLGAELSLSDRFAVSVKGSYADATEDFRKWNVFELRTDPTAIFYEVIGDFSTFDLAIGDSQNPALYDNLISIRNRPDIDEDSEVSGRIDFTWELGSSFIKALEFGGSWAKRDKAFRAFDGLATLSAVPNVTSFLRTFDFSVRGAPQGFPTSIVAVDDFDALLNAADPDGFGVRETLAARYDISEEVLAGYAMARFDTGRLSGNFGVRVTTTDQTSVGFETVGTTLQPASFENSYSHALPSINVRWDVTDTLVGRAAIYRSLTRPDLTDIQPGRRFDAFNGGNGTSGNTELDPFTATNYDIGAEWYFTDGGLLSATYFRKELNGFIERIVSETEVTDQVTGRTFTVNLSRPVNGQSATIQGVELGLQLPFFFLPGALADAGLVANATFTDSEAVFQNAADIRATSLPGLSDTSYNLVLYYDRKPFSARFAYNWRSDYLLTVSGTGGNPVSRDDYGQLDFAATLNLTDRLNLTFDALNLTDAQYRSFTFQNEDLARGLVRSGRRLVIGANFRF